MPNSVLDEKCIFDENNWVVSSYSRGFPGHAKIIIEGLKRDGRTNNLLYLIYEYEIGCHPHWKNRYVVCCDKSQRYTEAEYHVALFPSINGRSDKERFGLKVYYQKGTFRSSCIPRIKAEEITDNIDEEKTLNALYFNIAVKHGGIEKNLVLDAWVKESGYEPVYITISPTEGDDMCRSSTNCATWVNRKLRHHGLATSLPTSSGGSMPALMAHQWSGYSNNTGRLIFRTAVVTLCFAATFWWFKPSIETAAITLKNK